MSYFNLPLLESDLICQFDLLLDQAYINKDSNFDIDLLDIVFKTLDLIVLSKPNVGSYIICENNFTGVDNVDYVGLANYVLNHGYTMFFYGKITEDFIYWSNEKLSSYYG
jgi:hypothetical protein